MDSKKCVKCNNDDIDKIFPCDSCKNLLCTKCAGLTASEVACLRLKNGRKLIFLCNECESGLWKVPQLVKELQDLKESIGKLQQKLEKEELGQSNQSKTTDINAEEFMNEISERQKRASNVVVLNINESNKTVVSQRIEEDKNSIKQILDGIEVDTTNIKVYRLGKFLPNKVRPLKVCFSTRNDAITVLRNKKLIKIPSIKIFADQTKVQRDYFIKIKKQLEEFKERGEIKIIKYINNIPTLVDLRQPKN